MAHGIGVIKAGGTRPPGRAVVLAGRFRAVFARGGEPIGGVRTGALGIVSGLGMYWRGC
jgi:hypothetical protein